MTRFLLAAALALGLTASSAVRDDTSPFALALGYAEKALADGALDKARDEIRRAQERDPRSVRAWQLRARWAEAAGDRDELVYALHREHQLSIAQGLDKKGRAALQTRLTTVDPIAADVFALKTAFIGRLAELAEKYEDEERPHSAIRVHKEILALDPERVESQDAIQRLASAPDPSLAGDAKPKDLLAGVDLEWIRKHDLEHITWENRARLERENYITETNAGYEVLVRAAEAMEQMNAFYRQFFQYGTEEDGKSVPRIQLHIFKERNEYLTLGIGPPVEWSEGHFTGGAVETYIDESGGFEGTTGTLFHEAAHQFASLATNAAGWLNEGLASFFEGCRILSNGTVLMNQPASHRLFPLVERMEQGWMSSASDGINPDNPSASNPTKAPTFRIVLENEYEWGPPWYAPTWGVVYFLYNFQDPADGRFIYRDSFRDFVNASGGRSGEGAVENFQEVVLGNPKKPAKGTGASDLKLPATVEELDPIWKDWLTRLRAELNGQVQVERPYLHWARCAIQRGDLADATEHFEKGLVEDPSNVELLSEFAQHLAVGKNKDRAAKLLQAALSELERKEPVDEAWIGELEKELVKLDSKHKTLAKIQEDLARAAVGLVQRYMGEELYLQAMDLSWRIGTDFEVPEMFEYFEEAARRSKKSLSMWRLAYDEQSLSGWAEAVNSAFTPHGEVLEGEFKGEQEFDYRFLVLDEVTSGDFSMEAEISAEYGKVRFCGLVFGRKSLTDFHAAILYPPGVDADGIAKQGFADLTTFYGDGGYEIWRHTPIVDPAAAANTSRSEIWRKLRIDVTGRNVDVWLDDEHVATQEFGSLAVLRGTFGLILGPGKARFRNVRYLAREPRDPGSRIEREIRIESVQGKRGNVGYSWVGAKPPFPVVARWAGEPRASFDEVKAAPQLLVLWSIGQNDQIRLDEWLRDLAERHKDVGLKIVSIVNTWDDKALDAYLAEHPFPGVVGVDQLDREAGTGKTFQDYFINRFNLPRLVLIDIDGTVAWEGDPGFKIGVPWKAGGDSYLDAPLKDMLERGKVVELAAWRKEWLESAVPALHEGDVAAAANVLLRAREFDWRVDDHVLEAQTRLNALQQAFASPAELAEPLLAEEREPALAALAAWGEHLGTPIDLGAKELKRFVQTAAARDWVKAMKALEPSRTRLADGKEPVALERMLEKLAPLAGPFPRELAESLQAAAADGPEELGRAVLAAEGLPGRWLAQSLGW